MPMELIYLERWMDIKVIVGRFTNILDHIEGLTEVLKIFNYLL